MIDPANPDFTNTPASAQRPQYHYAPANPGAPPALSIVTPFYNTGEIFHETVRSVMQQTMQQFEWIIVNDGSTDPEALAILDAYRRRDQRIRVVNHDGNRGLSAARNTGFGAAQTDCVVQLDSDDMLEPTAAEKWWWFLTSYPEYGFVKGYTVTFGARERLHSTAFAVGAQFLSGNRVNPTAMIRRSVHQSVGGYDETIREGLEDWEFWLRCANGGSWGGSVPEYLDWRRRRPDPGDRWANLRSDERSTAMHQMFKQRYPRLWEKDGFPRPAIAPQPTYSPIPDDLPCANLLSKRSPRLLLIARCLTVGGGSKFKLDLVAQLARRGWQITIAVTDPDENPWLAQFAGVTPDIFILPNVVRLVDYPRLLRYLAMSRQVDAIVLTGSEVGYHLTPYLRAHLPNVPIVDYCHFSEPLRKNGGFPRLSLLYQDMLQGTGVSSQQLKQWMVERGGDAAKIAVHYTGIDADVWKPYPDTRTHVRQELGIAQNQPVIIFAGHISPQKQPRVLAGVALRLKQQGQPFTMLVAGRGPDLPWLRRFTDRRLRGRVHLLGEVAQERMQQLLAASDIFFLPSRNEGISLAVFEAMACGLAIVGADVGGQRELVTPDCGVLVAPDAEAEDIEAYAAALTALLEQPQQRQAMGTAARARVQERFRLERMGDGIEALITGAHARCAAPEAQPDLAAGRACAASAIEYMRLERSAAAAQRARPALSHGGWRAYPERVGLWLKYPPAHLRPFVTVTKRMFPEQLKSALKRRLGVP